MVDESGPDATATARPHRVHRRRDSTTRRAAHAATATWQRVEHQRIDGTAITYPPGAAAGA
jgi:hypothetical protein